MRFRCALSSVSYTHLDVYKRQKYIGANLKYYFTDLGLRNARLNFRQQEPTHIMENIVYNELLIRGYNVDVGVVDIFGKDKEVWYVFL